MRAQKSEKKQHKLNGCVVCKNKTCSDTPPQVILRINPAYPGVITRSITKILDYISDFIIIEVYRCMPLLGDEQENAPDWDVHIVRYAIVFTNKYKKLNKFNGFTKN